MLFKSKAEMIIVSVIATTFLGITISFFYRRSILREDGVIVVGRVIKTDEFHNGYVSTIAYSINDNEYIFTYNALPKIMDTLVFVEVSKSKPKWRMLIVDRKVPVGLRYGDIVEKQNLYSP